MSLADSLRESDELDEKEAEELIAFFRQHLGLDLALDQAPAFQARRAIDLKDALSSTLDGLAQVLLLLPDVLEATPARNSLLAAYLRILGEVYLSIQALHVLNYISRGSHRSAYSRMLSTLREADRRKADFSLLPHELRSMVYDRT